MRFGIVSAIIVIQFLCLKIAHSQDYCKRRVSKFNRYPTEFESDYYNLRLSANIAGKHLFQTESAVLVLNTSKSNKSVQALGAGTFLFRYGLFDRIELRAGFSIADATITRDFETRTNSLPIALPFNIGSKIAVYYSKKHKPIIAVLPEMVFDNDQIAFRLGVVTDLKYSNIFQFTWYSGIQNPSDLGNVFQYSMGIILNSQNANMGIYCLATNRFLYLDDLLNFGFVFRRRNLNFTIGYGVHEDNGSILFGMTIQIGRSPI